VQRLRLRLRPRLRRRRSRLGCLGGCERRDRSHRRAAPGHRPAADRRRRRARSPRGAVRRVLGPPDRDAAGVGVTGTSGKTTTAYLLHSILDAAGPPARSARDDRDANRLDAYAAEAPTPVAFHLQRTFREMLDAGNRACVIEATSYEGACNCFASWASAIRAVISSA